MIGVPGRARGVPPDSAPQPVVTVGAAARPPVRWLVGVFIGPCAQQ